MAYQPISLGTPNNNDGDSLYAGGVKINSNFSELYTALAGASGATLKITIGSTTPGTSTTLGWSNSLQAFVPTSSDAIRTLGSNSASAVFITNNTGVSGGVNSDLLGMPNTNYLQINGRQIYNIRARTTGTAVNTRAEVHFGLGLSNVTALSILTTSVLIRGLNGLEVYRAAAEDNAAYTKLLDSGSFTTSGVQLYLTPTLDFTSMSVGVRNGSDSSNALAHTGFVKLLLGQYALSSTTVRGVRGIVGQSSNLTGGIQFNVDGIYHPKHIEGLIYNYNTSNNVLTLVTGAAAHWSYSTSGVAGIDQTTAIAIVASYTPILRTFVSGWTPSYDAVGSTPAVIDATVIPNTWYYLYYIGCLQQHTIGSQTFYPGSSNVVVSSNRDIASVDAQLRAAGYGPAGPNGYWQVVRRIGPVKTDGQASPRLLPFNVKRIDHGGFEYYWGLQGNGYGATNGADTSYTVLAYPAVAGAPNPTMTNGAFSSIVGTVQVPRIFLSSDTLIVGGPTANYTSALLTTIPPIPGVTAHLTVRHRPSAAVPYIYFHGEAWTVNSSISALYPPFEVVRSTQSGITHIHNIQLPMSPDGCYIPDGTYGGAGILSVTTSAGQYLRYAMVAGETSTGVFTSAAQLGVNGSSLALGITVTGFRYAR